MRPIANTIHIAVLHWVIVQIVHARRIVIFIIKDGVVGLSL